MNKETDPIKKNILQAFLHTIEILADKEYQRRVWIDGRGPECHDFDEAVCDFHEFGEDIFKNPNDYGINELQHRALLNFRDVFTTFCSGPGLEYYLPQFFLDTPEWTNITAMAKELRLLFA